ncbi:dihydropteroate synthase [Campylobacter sp. MG1]|uniref:dihydropteroate synthase n=1 Tax=Campylobacter sp. MG1 TaxID=2976332 RepID=UPI00226CE4D6|nr:dihydropteroate synthase [Campylobacter sp. MG1]
MKEAEFFIVDKDDAININATPYAEDRFFKKTNQHYIYIKNISAVAANILKQDAISVGANVLNHKNAILGNSKNDSILEINDVNIKDLSDKLKLQQFSCNRLSNFLDRLKINKKYPKIMAIMNINNDSFYENSRIKIDDFLTKTYDFIENGASIIDIGAMSSRPNSKYLGENIEFDRLKPIFKIIKENNLCDKIDFSLDSFSEKCLKNALDLGFKYINDISANTSLSNLAIQYDATYILMHSKNNYIENYVNSNCITSNYNNDKFVILNEVYNFFKTKLQEISSKVIIDFGIGFGKNEFENLVLIKYLNHFKTLGKEILLAASNKRCFANERELLSLIAHAKSGADYIRVHDVKKQSELLKYLKKMDEI